jgi:hypothetical protein
MKYNKSILAIIAFFAFSTLTAQTATEKWPQLGNFKELLNKTFQPAEGGNFKPIKNSSEQLVMAAEALKEQTIPKEWKNGKVIEISIVLKKKAKTLHELIIKKAPDAEVMRAFQDVHDVYVKLVTSCEPTNK